MKNTYLKLTILFFFSQCLVFSQQNVELRGTILDETDFPIPYAAIGIPSKYIGTASTEDGTFYLKVSKNNLQDTLEVSSIGFKTFKVLVKDYIESEAQEIVLQEDIVSLSEVKLLNPVDYVKLCVKNLKKTTLSEPHKLDVLYRRFSTEKGKSRFLIEQFLHVIDKGPSSQTINKMKVIESRQSADYRFLKRKSTMHNMNYTVRFNPFRTGLNISGFNWKKIGDSSYDGEDLIIVEGRKKDKQSNYIRLYIGLDTFSAFKIETSYLNTTYIYKKNIDGKLYLSYHNREARFHIELSEHQKKLLKTNKETAVTTYRHELFVLGLSTDKKSFKFDNYGQFSSDMADLEVKYNPVFWKNFSLPPETKFYKKNIEEIESIFGVPIEDQFNLVNK